MTKNPIKPHNQENNRIEETVRLALRLSQSEYDEAATSAAMHLAHLGSAALPVLHRTLLEGFHGNLRAWDQGFRDVAPSREEREHAARERAAHDQAILMALGAIADPSSLATLDAYLKMQPRGTDDTPNRLPRYTQYAPGGTGPFARQSLAAWTLSTISKLRTSQALDVFLRNVWHIDDYHSLLFAGIQRFGEAGHQALLKVAEDSDKERAAIALSMLAMLENPDAVQPALRILATGEGKPLASAVLLLKQAQRADTVEAVEAFLEEGLKNGANPEERPSGWGRDDKEKEAWRGADVLPDVIELYSRLVKEEAVPLLLRFAALGRIERGRPMGFSAKRIIAIGSNALPALLSRAQNQDAAVSRAAIELASRLKNGPEDGRFPEHW